MSDKLTTREVEVDDDEAQQILEETRHRQIQKSFAKLTEAVIASNGSDIINAAINKQILAIDGFSEAIKEIELNPTEIVSSLFKIREDIVASNEKLIAALENRLLPDTFTLNKGNTGITESVKVNYKEANKLKN